MTQFNPQQQLAIDELDKNIIVSASAGAGKTTVLIARLMKRILQDKVHIQEICALTFTDAAAQEMKTRLLKEMHEEFQNNKSEFLEEQIALVETAEISTIHSYCLSLIKNFGYIIGINPSRSENILDDAQVKLLKKEAFDSVLKNWLETRYQDSFDLVEYFSPNPIDTYSFESAVYEAGIWLRGRKNPDKVIEEILSTYNAPSFEDWPDSFKDIFFIKYEEIVSQSLFHLSNVIDIVERDAKETTKAYKNNAVLRNKSDLLSQIHIKLKNRDISFYDDILSAFDFSLPAVRGSEDFKEARDPLTKIAEETISLYRPLEEQFTMMNRLVTTITNFIDFTRDYLSEYQKLKESDNVLDFDDFEHYALELLKANNFAISKELQNHYKEIMIDEFQDTNEIQDEIIRLISNGKNLFRVGDIKQSIYRFRGAKPQIMKDLMQDEDHQNLYLSYNYRSKEPIVMFNNIVFDRLMNLSNYSEYTENDHVLCGLDSQKEGGNPVELHLFERQSEDGYERNPNQQRAAHIAQEIIKHHKEGYKFKDMTVLVRGHAQKPYLKRAFEDANIPHYISERVGFFNSEIVASVLDFLRYSLSGNEYYLANLLLSPFYSLNEDNLASIKLIGDDNFRKQLEIYDKKLFKDIHDMLDSWKSKDIVSILQEIFTLNNAYNEKLSLQDKTNLDFLLEKALLFQDTSTPSVQGFLLFFAALDDDQSSEASHLSVDDDLVEVMTVHQSKGLQFPLVFYWGSGSLRVRDHSSTLVFDDNLGLGLNTLILPYRLSTKTLVRELIEYKQTHEELEEMLRLLYVALTRPQEKLIVVDVHSSFEKHDLNKHLLLNYKRQVDLLFASSSANTTQVIIRDAEDIDTEFLEKEIVWGSAPQFETLKLSIPKSSGDFPMSGFDLNPQSKWAMEFGTTLHDAIEVLPHILWDSESLASYDLPIRTRLFNYNHHKFTQELYHFPTIEHELPFLVKEDGDIINGIIDFVAMNEEEIVIVDFKSDNTSQEVLFERYSKQLLRYKNALEAIYPERNISVYIYSFHLNDYLPLSL